MTPEEARNIVLGEWRATEDEVVARELYSLVKDVPVSRYFWPVLVAHSLKIGTMLTLLLTLPVVFAVGSFGVAFVLSLLSLWLILVGGVMFWRRLPHPRLAALGAWIDQSRDDWDLLQSLLAVLWFMGLLLAGVVFALRLGLGIGRGDELASPLPILSIIITYVLCLLPSRKRAVKHSASLSGVRSPSAVLRFLFRQVQRPTRQQLIEALQCLVYESQTVEAWKSYIEGINAKLDRAPSVANCISALTGDRWLGRLWAQIALCRMGGVALGDLGQFDQKRGYAGTVALVMREIAAASEDEVRTQAARLVCPSCFTRPSKCTVSFGKEALEYWGCRICGRSKDFLAVPGEIIATLDTAWREPSRLDGETLRVNALTRKGLFDFDRVEILQAPEKAIERFCIVVGNDTDPLRKDRYIRMPVVVPASISEDVWRMVDHLFGTVTVREGVGHDA